MNRRRWLRLTGAMRRVWALTVWQCLVLLWCRRVRIEGRGNIPRRPVIVVANHASHADTVLLQYVLATCHDRPVLVAGAEDYWFRRRSVGLLARTLGVFAFPRKGAVGVARARRALELGASVVLFPQGSRSGGRFRAGVGRIATVSHAPVVPIHLEGPSNLLPKGRHWPRRARVVIRIGEPTFIGQDETPERFAERLERIVQHELEVAA